MEERKDIEGFEDIYQISNLGNVKSLERIGYRITGTHTIPERILKSFESSNGTRTVTLYFHDPKKPGKNKKFRVHRLVANHFIPNPEGKTEVFHLNRDRTDNRVDNLRRQTSVARALNRHRNEKKKKL